MQNTTPSSENLTLKKFYINTTNDAKDTEKHTSIFYSATQWISDTTFGRYATAQVYKIAEVLGTVTSSVKTARLAYTMFKQLKKDPSEFIKEVYKRLPELQQRADLFMEGCYPELGQTPFSPERQEKIDALKTSYASQIDQIIQYSYALFDDAFITWIEENPNTTINIVTASLTDPEPDIEANQRFPFQHRADLQYQQMISQELGKGAYVYLVNGNDLYSTLKTDSWIRMERGKFDPAIRDLIHLIFSEVRDILIKDKTLIFDLAVEGCKILSNHSKEFSDALNNNQFEQTADALETDPWKNVRKEISEKLGKQIIDRLFPKGVKDLQIQLDAGFKYLLPQIAPKIAGNIIENALSEITNPKAIIKMLNTVLADLPDPSELAKITKDKGENEAKLPPSLSNEEKNLIKSSLISLENHSGDLAIILLSLASPQFKNLFHTGKFITSFDPDQFENIVSQSLGQSLVKTLLPHLLQLQGEGLFERLMQELEHTVIQPEMKIFKQNYKSRQQVCSKLKNDPENALRTAADQMKTIKEQQLLTKEKKDQEELHQAHFKVSTTLSNFYPYLTNAAQGVLISTIRSLILPQNLEDTKYGQIIKVLGKAGTVLQKGAFSVAKWCSEFFLTYEYTYTRRLKENSDFASKIISALQSPFHEKAIYKLTKATADRILNTDQELQKNKRSQTEEGNYKTLPPPLKTPDHVGERKRELVGKRVTVISRTANALKWRDMTIGLIFRGIRRLIRPTTVGIVSALHNVTRIWNWNRLTRSVAMTAVIGLSTLLIIPIITSYGIMRFLYDTLCLRPLFDADWVRELDKESLLEKRCNLKQWEIGNKGRWLIGSLLPTLGHLVDERKGDLEEKGKKFELTTKAESEDDWIVDTYRKWDRFVITIGSTITR